MSRKALSIAIATFPWIGFLGVLACCWLGSSQILSAVNSQAIHLAEMYSAIFGWSAIQTGFLFGVYGFIASKPDGFISAIKNTPAMKQFIREVKWATIGGFFLSFTSMPLVIFEPEPTSKDYLYLIISVWSALFVWAFLYFLRVAYVFGQIVRVPDNNEKPSR